MISHKDLKPNNFYKKFVPSGYWYMYIYTVGENIISQWVCKYGKDDAVAHAPARFYFEDGWEQASLDDQAFENIDKKKWLEKIRLRIFERVFFGRV